MSRGLNGECHELVCQCVWQPTRPSVQRSTHESNSRFRDEPGETSHGEPPSSRWTRNGPKRGWVAMGLHERAPRSTRVVRAQAPAHEVIGPMMQRFNVRLNCHRQSEFVKPKAEIDIFPPVMSISSCVSTELLVNFSAYRYICPPVAPLSR